MRPLACLLLLLALAGPLTAATQRSIRVLVVGSEWSEQHRWPLMSALMAAGAKPPVGVALRSLVARGASLDALLATETATRQLADGPWDLVLVQVHPLAVAFERAACLAAIERLVERVEARRILVWHPPGPSVGTARRERLEAELDALIARLGRERPVARWRLDRAWDAALALGQPIEDDLGLPTPQGGYLLACALFAAYTGRDPRQAVHHLDHAALEPLWLPAETAEILQRAADLARNE